MSHIVVDKDGNIKLIYEDDLVGLLREKAAGAISITRASHVEPTVGGCWTADLTPVRGPVLGPFATRQEALTAEVNWINTNVL